MAQFSVNAERFDQPTVLHSRGTGGLTASAVQTEVQMPCDRLSQLQPTVDDGSHQVNAAAGTIVFVAGLQIGGACRRAQPAVNAVEEEIVVDIPARYGRVGAARRCAGGIRLI